MVKYIFNSKGDYVAFISNRNLFTPDCKWLGVVINNNVFDTQGKYLGTISSDDRIIRNNLLANMNIAKPAQPYKPIRPNRPTKRLRMNSVTGPYEDVFYSNNSKLQVYKIPDISRFINCKIIATDGTFLGTIDNNKFSNDSISNQYGPYGSRYSPTSIFNSYCAYGSEYNLSSVKSKYTITPPKLVKNDQFVAYLTSNKNLRPHLLFDDLIKWLESIN